MHFPPKQVSTIKFRISQPIVPQQVHCGCLWANLAKCQKHTKSVVTSTLCQNFSPVLLALVKLSQKVYSVASFKTISFEDHCTSVWVNISHMAYFFRYSQPICIYLGHIQHSFQDPCPSSASKRLLTIPFKTLAFILFAGQWLQDSSYSNHQCLTGMLKTSNVHLKSGRVKSP